MKNSKILVVLLTVALVVALTVVGFVVNADDVISVGNAAEFRTAMVEANAGKTIELTANIDLGADGNTTMGGTFTGTFDGKGYTVSGITNTLFNKISGTVKNVTLEGSITYLCNESGLEGATENGVSRDIARKAATLAFDADGATVADVVSYVDITTTAKNTNAGGIIGYAKKGTYTNVTYAGNYVLNWYSNAADIGGIIGYTNNNGTATYENCIFAGTITVNALNANVNGQRGAASAILGDSKLGTNNFVNCLNLGTITFNNGEFTPATCAAGVIAYSQTGNNTPTVNITNCVNLGTFIGTETVANAVATGAEPTNVTGAYGAADATETVVRQGATYMTFAEGVYVNVTAGKFVDEIPAPGTLLGGGMYNINFSLEKDGTKAVVVWLADSVGGADTVAKAASGEYKTELIIDGVSYTNLVSKGAGRYWVIDLEASDITTIKNGETYDLSLTIYDADGVRLYYANPMAKESNVDTTGAPVEPGVLLGSGMYNINFSLEKDGTKAVVVYLADSVGGADTVAKAASGEYKTELTIDGVTYTNLVSKGAGRYLVIDLEASDITNIKSGETYDLSFKISDANGVRLYYANPIERESNVDTVPPVTEAPETTVTPVETEAPETTETPDTPVAPETAGFSAGTITGENGKYTISSEDFSAFISSKANVVGGKSDLRIVLVANYDVLCDNDDAVLTVEIGGKTITMSVVDELKVYQSATAAGEVYTAAEDSVLFGLVIENIPNDAWDNIKVTLTSEATTVAGELAKEDAITHAMGQPVPGGIYTGFGIENHHGSTNNTATAIVYFYTIDIANEIKDNGYSIKILWDGELRNAPLFAPDGNMVRTSLESAGITGIMRGEDYTFEVQIFNADGDLVYYSGMLTFTSKCFSTDIPAQNVLLPLEGLKPVTVDKDTLSFAGIDVWNVNTESVAQLFDGNTNTTKMGGGVPEVDGKRKVTINFSLTEAATLSYYTFYTGNDTNPGSDRNPIDWILYGKVGEEWVALSEVGFTGPAGIEAIKRAPYNFAVTNPQECKDYQLVLTTNGSFQLNELVLYTNDATVTGTTQAAAVGDAYLIYINRNNWLKNEEGTYQFKIGTKADSPYKFFNGTSEWETINGQPMWVYIKDTTNGGEYVRYEVTNFKTERHCDILFDADGFTPVEGATYDIVLCFVSADASTYPNSVYAIQSWGFQLGKGEWQPG